MQNLQPTLPPPGPRLAILADCPTLDDARLGQAWSEPVEHYKTSPAKFMRHFLGTVGVLLDHCFLGYVCQVPMAPGLGARLSLKAEQVQAGMVQLRADLAQFKPTHILACGSLAIRACKEGLVHGAGNWRGSLWMSQTLTAEPVKVLAVDHPGQIQADWQLTATMRLDMEKLARELASPSLVLPVRNIQIDLSPDQILANLAQIRSAKLPVSLDLEGWIDWISCIGFAVSGTEAFVVPFISQGGESWWDLATETRLWEAIAGVLEDPAVPKIGQNLLYEGFVLAWTYGIVLRGIQDDTMLKHFELYAELDKNLAYQASIYTSEPYYKAERKSQDDRIALLYNGKDCCVTWDCNQAMTGRLSLGQAQHYQFNLALLPVVLYMELRGLRYDSDKAAAKLVKIQRRIKLYQHWLNQQAGRVAPATEAELVEAIKKAGIVLAKPRRRYEQQITKTYKNGKVKTSVKKVSEAVQVQSFQDCLDYCKASGRGALEQVRLALGNQSNRENNPKLVWRRPEVCINALGLDLNINSTSAGGDAQWFLYEHCRVLMAWTDGAWARTTQAPGQDTTSLPVIDWDSPLKAAGGSKLAWVRFPKQFAKDGNKLTDKLTTDTEALVKLWSKTHDRRVLRVIKLRKFQTLTETLSAKVDPDGRIRCQLNIVGTETDRFACYGSPTGSGYNLQTVTKSSRDMFTADPGCLLAQCDLAGSDGWTVAAYAALFGDRNMLDDYKAGLKPARIVARTYEKGYGFVSKLDRVQLKQDGKLVDDEGWLYFASKRVQHSSCYGTGLETMANQILTDSFKLTGKPIHVDQETCKQIQEALWVRYPGIKRWHTWMWAQLGGPGRLTSSVGFTRLFFGRKQDGETWRAALAHLPQVYTTAATKLAILRSWSDSENRLPDGSLVVEPLLTVHDSFIVQFKSGSKDWAKAKLRDWFSNPIQIANEVLTIRFDGTVGGDWQMKPGKTASLEAI